MARLSEILGVGDYGTTTRLLVPGLIGGTKLAGGVDITGTMVSAIMGGRVLDKTRF